MRHIQMLGDCMTYRGEVLGINRYGIARMSTSVLMNASFERPTEHLFEAAVHQRSDQMKGVSESIILGSTINLGTGLFKLLYDFGGKQLRTSSSVSTASAEAVSCGSSARTPLLTN